MDNKDYGTRKSNGCKALDKRVQLTSLNLDKLHYTPKKLNGKIKIIEIDSTYNILKYQRRVQPLQPCRLSPLSLFYVSKMGL